MATLIDGKRIAAQVRASVAEEVAALAGAGVIPGLAVILVGDDPASQIYVRSKVRHSQAAGFASFEHCVAATVTQDELLALVAALNADDRVDGILVQLPLPRHMDVGRILEAIDPLKDVDGLHPVNIGRLTAGTGGLVPCTPLGCMMLLDTVVSDYSGLKAVVIGKSYIVGKPVALLLLERKCTVTVTHIATRNLSDIVRTADVLIVAAGAPGLVRGDWVKPGAIVIDVGINRIPDGDGYRIVGDAGFAEMDHAGAISPVPGGVGPMTIACLLKNTARAARMRRSISVSSVPFPLEAVWPTRSTTSPLDREICV